MRKYSLIILAIPILIIAGCNDSGKGQDDSPFKDTPAMTGEKAPFFEIKSIGGDSITSDSFTGHVAVINFWATWCEPCKKEAEALRQGHEYFKARNVVFVGIAVKDARDKVELFVDEYNIKYPNGIDKDETISKLYNVPVLPVTFIIDKDGTIKYRKIGEISEKELKKEIRRNL